MTRSEIVKDALERALGLKDPYALLEAVRSSPPAGDLDASQDVSRKFRAKLRAKRPA